MLVPSHECWSHPTGAGPIPWVLAPHQGRWSSYQGTSSRVLGVLEEGEDPPLQHRPGGAPVLPGEQRRGHPGGQYSPCPLRPPPPALPSPVVGDTGICLPEPLPSVHCLGPVEYPGFFEAFKLEDKAGRGCQACPLPFLVPGFGKVWLPLPRVLTFSSLSPSTGGTVLCQAKSPLSWLEPLLARSWRPPTGTWGGREGGSG